MIPIFLLGNSTKSGAAATALTTDFLGWKHNLKKLNRHIRIDNKKKDRLY